MVHELYTERYERWRKSSVIRKNAVFSKLMKIFYLRFDTTIYIPVPSLLQSLNFVSFELAEKYPVKIFMPGLGRFITDIDYMVKKKKILF